MTSSSDSSRLEGVRLAEDAVPKTVAGKTVGGSNPSPSAKSFFERLVDIFRSSSPKVRLKLLRHHTFNDQYSPPDAQCECDICKEGR